MARKIQVADGNFTGTNWANCVTATAGSAEVDSETTQALSTGNHDSALFTLPATEIDGVALKLAANTQAAITFTVHLRNSTTATNDRTVTVNAADMPACSTTLRNGGWQFFRFATPITPNGTDQFLIRCTLSAGTTISLWRDGTVNNFSRFIRGTATSAPAAADRFIMARELTGAGTGTSHTMTMDETASTVYGTNSGLSANTLSSGGAVNASLCVCSGATLTWGNAASTNYLFRSTGPVMVYSGGTWIRGTSVSQIPGSSTAILEFVQTVTGDSGFGKMAGSTVTEEGSPRTPANLTVWCKLNTDEAAGQTVLGVDTDTGWLAGDLIAIGSTTRTQSQGELRTLNSNATLTTLEITVALTNNHAGSVSDDLQAWVVNLSRNVITRSDNSARLWKNTVQAGDVSLRWVLHQFCGASSETLNVPATNYTVEYCAFDRVQQNALNASDTADNFVWRHNVAYVTSNFTWPTIATSSPTNWACTDMVGIFTAGGGMTFSNSSGAIGEIHNWRGTVSINISQGGTPTTPIRTDFGYIETISTLGISLSLYAPNRVIEGIKARRCLSTGIIINPNIHQYTNTVFKNLVAFGCGTQNVSVPASTGGDITFDNPIIAGDTSFSTASGIVLQSAANTATLTLKLNGGTLGGGGGTKTTHTGADILWGEAGIGVIRNLVVVNTDLLSGTEVTAGTGLRQPSFYARQSPDGTLANSSLTLVGVGTVAYNTSVVDAPFTVSEHLIPSVTFGATLKSSPVTIKVSSGVAPDVEVRVRYTAAYNGAFLPRLVVQANPAVGLDDDTIIDTAPGATADTWLTIGGTLPTPTANGKFLMYVEVDGTLDGAFVSLWSSGSEAVEPGFWLDGLTGGEMDAATGGGGGGGGTRSAVSFG